MVAQSVPPVHLVTVATAVPENVLDQAAAADLARRCFASRIADYDRLSRVFGSTGIDRRYTTVPSSWFDEPHGWAERTSAYVTGASALFERAVAKALAAAVLDASQIDAVVFVSSTGISTPSIEARMLPKLGFRPDTMRVPVFGLGCAGGVSGFALAARLAAARPGTTVLLVAVELCSLAFRIDRATKADVIATSLFADGAAAAILSSGDGPGPTIVGATEHLWPETLDVMGWSVDEVGLGVALSRSLPSFVASRYRDVYDAALARMDIHRAQVDRVVCHPGGAKVLDALETALDVPVGTLDHERTVMRDFGNMSSPTALFVLERAMQAGLPPLAVFAALGPGFTASFVALAQTG
ncbi:MAG: type III polyketide synthase [Candidatus Eremiobacteraeota bacterium]|nr:type III polyketide synthase [Candidatus Eremiobacteraeota bacterium]